MPVGHGTKRNIALRSAAFVLDAITPLCLGHALFFVYFKCNDLPLFHTDSWILNILLPMYTFVEVVFFVQYCFSLAQFQRKSPVDPMPSHMRAKYFSKVMNEFKGKEFLDFLSGWFMWEDSKSQLTREEVHELRRDNVKEWLSWSFFGVGSLEDVEQSPFINQELERMVTYMELQRGVRFQPGRNDDIRAIMLNYNEVEAYSKPLIMYATIFMLENAAFLFLKTLGFKRYKFRVHHPNTSIRRKVFFSYWARIPRNRHHHHHINTPSQHNISRHDTTPFVFVHGIGGGLFCYVKFIYKLVKNLGRNRPFFLLELPHVSMKLVSSETVTNMQETVQEVESMLNRHGFKTAHFAGHSLGSIYCAWIIKYSKIVESIVLLDPVCFKIYHPTLAYHFVYRIPKRANEFLTHWIVSRELYVSHYICRHFVWHHNVLFPEDLPHRRSYVILSEDDNLVDVPLINQYLEDNKVPHTMLPKADHAQFLLNPVFEDEIVKKITEMVHGNGGASGTHGTSSACHVRRRNNITDRRGGFMLGGAVVDERKPRPTVRVNSTTAI